LKSHTKELVPYGFIGLVATAVHYCAQSFNLKVLALPSAGFVNLIAEIVGIRSLLWEAVILFLKNRGFIIPASNQIQRVI